MKSKWLLLTALAMTLAGCTLMETRPGSPSSGSTAPGGHVPEPPAEQVISDRGPVPDLPASTHIIVGLCPATGSYAALGVDTQARKFTFLISGHEATRQQAFQKFFAAGVPVTVYTQVTALSPNENGKSLGFDPCLNLQSGAPRLDSSASVIAQAAEDPPPTPKPTGGGTDNLAAFATLSWRTAFALAPVSHPASKGGGSAF
jgi:hypothetical protein